MKTLRLLSLFFILAISLSSCDDDTEVPEPITKTDLLAKKWERRPPIEDDEYYNDISNYQSWLFYESGSMVYDLLPFGSYKMKTTFGNWRFNEDETQIIMDNYWSVNEDDREIVWNIEELTESSLHVSFTRNFDGVEYTYKYYLIPYQY